jgi:predicted nucleic acid-binding protein
VRDLIKEAVEAMRPQLLKSKVKPEDIDAVLRADPDHEVDLYDKLVVIRRDEHEAVVKARQLVPDHMWDYYESRNITYLKECKILSAAQKKLREAWRQRVQVFAPKEKAK